MKKIECKIINNKEVAPGFYKMSMESKYLARQSKPGQFVEVKCSDAAEPLLRRPLGVHRISRSGIELLYEVVGKGTQILSCRKPGELLDVIGPLGNGFNLKPATNNYQLATILIAGGNGVAPLVALAEKLAFSVKRLADSKKSKIYVFVGAKTKSHILCEKDFKKIGCDVRITTDDGSKGKKGMVTDLMRYFLNARNFQRKFHHYPLNATIYACGPTGMLKAVAKIAADRKIPCQVSLEERMACGVGVCLGCPVKVRGQGTGGRGSGESYKIVCKDGPVFNAEEIAW